MQTMLKRTDISLILPIYNLEKYLTPMLSILKEQDLGGYTAEIIFVLNNCTDRSEEIIRNSGLECTIMNCEEQGCGCARNMGFEHSVGEYIWFLDGDDWLLSKTAVKDALDGVKGHDILRIPFESNLFNTEYFSMVWQYIFKRSLIEDIRFRKVQPAEDDDYMNKVFTKMGITAWAFKTLPALEKPLYFYNYLREGSNMYRYLRGEDINARADKPSDPMKLQLLTPHYKEEPWEMLPLLDSVALQQAVDFKDIGMVIVYDGDEATPLPEEEWKAKYPFEIQFVHAPHGGVSAARNAALDAAVATYVMFCDADDMFFHMCGINVILREVDKGDFDTMTTLFFEETRDRQTGASVFLQHPNDTTFVHGKIHRREYLNENGIRFDPRLKIHEDSYFNVLCKLVAQDPRRVKYHPTGVFLWRWRDNSICRRDPIYMQKTYPQLIDSNDALVDELERRGLHDRAAFYCGCMILETYYAMNKPEWRMQEHLKYRRAAEKRIGQYLKKHRKLWESISPQDRMDISNTLRTRYISEGMLMESKSFANWLKLVEESK